MDPLTVNDSHASPGPALKALLNKGKATPLLIVSGSIYPQRRGQSVIFRGVDPNQNILSIPTNALLEEKDSIPALIGKRMAQQTGLSVGDFVTARWRDTDGTFDATDIKIVSTTNIPVPNLDSRQIWLPLDRLREMIGLKDELTLLITKKQYQHQKIVDKNFVFKSQDYLLKDERAMIKAESYSYYILYVIVLGMGLLAIFDTQVLAIFRRQKEIGLFLALGLQRWQVITLFTLEGSLYGALALLVGAIWGLPLIFYSSFKGIPLPELSDQSGFAIGSKIYTTYTLDTSLGLLSLLFLSVVIVSFVPLRKIVCMKITDAIKGRA